MKNSVALTIVLFASELCFAAHSENIDNNPKNVVSLLCCYQDSLETGGVAKITKRSKNRGKLLLDVSVKLNVNMSSYPGLVAYLDGKAITEYKMKYYAHLKGMTMDYTVEIPKKYKKSLDKISFRLEQTDGSSVRLK